MCCFQSLLSTLSAKMPNIGRSPPNPSSIPSAKRPKSETSPVTSLNDVLYAIKAMEQNFQGKLSNLATKDDVNDIKQQLGSVSQKMCELEEENKALKEEIKILKADREADRRELRNLSENIRNKNVVVKGLNLEMANKDNLGTFLQEKLELPEAKVRETRIIFRGKNNVGVVAEFKCSKVASEVLKNSKKLAGSSVFIERDLCEEKRTRKRVLLQIKKTLSTIDRSKKVFVHNDSLNVCGKWMNFDSDNVLKCGGAPALGMLKDWYGDSLDLNNLNYDKILQNIMNKKN